MQKAGVETHAGHPAVKTDLEISHVQSDFSTLVGK